MQLRRHRFARNWRVFLIPLALVLVLWLRIIPYDHPFLLSIRFNVYRVIVALQPHCPDCWWLTERPAFPVVLSDDVAILVKSGFGTKHRISAWLEAHEHNNFANLLLVGDFSTLPGEYFSYNAQQLPVHDLVAWMLEKGYLSADLAHPRLVKYTSLSAAIASGDLDTARDLSTSFGWELDALKFISGLELCYNQMPDKKWYIMADDDTYLVQPSLRRLLEHFDPDIPHYIGNAVGDFLGRFAHGGSSVILSQATMRQLFASPQIVSAAYRESLSETWGDKLVATTLQKLGIYLDEGYVVFFNGEQPRLSKLTADRFCAPILSFHGLSSPANMRNVGQTFQHVTEPVLWIDLWEIYVSLPLDSPELESGLEAWDYVGRLDEMTRSIEDIPSAQNCHQICQEASNFCLAWTWDSKVRACHLSPWIISGERAEGKTSGINVPRAKGLADACRS